MKKVLRLTGCVASSAACLLLALSFAPRAAAQKGSDEMALPDRGRVRAPEFTNKRGWLNIEHPLSLAALRGKAVLLDFWTYGCINCLHIIPDLKRLEAKYRQNLVVVGVHSAKFENEKETDNIRRIVLRYEIEHPIINDADLALWQAYAVRAWPTQILIDPAGYVVGKVEGEGHYEAIDKAIADTLTEFRKRGGLNESPLKLALERAKVADLQPLAFPGKLLADAATDRLYIADSNHNRIVVAKLDGTFLDAIGTGARGATDGATGRATFSRPQGLALGDDLLYVADTGHHLLRCVDLKARTVRTIAGTGQQARGFDEESARAPRLVALNSPWDLQLVGQTLYVAMAGPHQIWNLDLAANRLSVFAGSGREARFDSSRLASAFAQPSGLATDGRAMLYVADSESNIIRAVDLSEPASAPSPDEGDPLAAPAMPGEDAASPFPAAPSDDSPPPAAPPASDAPPPPQSEGETETASALPTPTPAPQVQTLAGGDLFVFGDSDGIGESVRLQHPLGVAYADGAVFIADTYNHKLKRLDAQTRAVKTLAGTGQPGHIDGGTAVAAFYEPGGLSVARGKLYVADTNNHAVRVYDLASGQTSTLNLRGLRPPPAASAKTPEAETNAALASVNAEEIELAPQRLARSAATMNALVIEVALPANYHLNELAPHQLQISVETGAERVALAGSDAGKLTRAGKELLTLPLRLPLRALSDGAAELRVQLTLYYCREDNTGACRLKTLIWRAPLNVTGETDAPHEIKLQGEIK